MKKKGLSKEQAALTLTLLTEKHLKPYPPKERDRMIKAFGRKVSELRKRML